MVTKGQTINTSSTHSPYKRNNHRTGGSNPTIDSPTNLGTDSIKILRKKSSTLELLCRQLGGYRQTDLKRKIHNHISLVNVNNACQLHITITYIKYTCQLHISNTHTNCIEQAYISTT